MTNKQEVAPDNTAVRTALWRALHVEVDSPPHVFKDEIGLKLAAPDDEWRNRLDMSPFTRPFRASIISQTGQMAFAHPIIQRNCWWQPPCRLQRVVSDGAELGREAVGEASPSLLF